MLQGANLGVTKTVTGSVSSQNINQMDGYASLNFIFAHVFQIGPVQLNITVIWWLLFAVFSAYILQRTRIGNWIYAVGGNAASARAVGVPVTRVKIGLFMTVAFLAWFTGMHYLYNFNVLQAGNGVGNEFLYIIAAVVGGTLMTGGYGNSIGVAIGAFIFGMTSLCIVYAGWDPNWFRAFLGVMLLLAVLVNLRRGQDVRRHPRAQGHQPHGQRGRGVLRPRGQRRGQVDADQDHRRPAPAQRGPDARGRPARSRSARPARPSRTGSPRSTRTWRWSASWRCGATSSSAPS